MRAVAQIQRLVSVEDYLESELSSEVRHEYVGGYVYAMAGASADHNRIAGNIFGVLLDRLRGKHCEPFMADMKFKIAESQAFYYPDILLACDPTDNARYFRERPTVVFEILSNETQRIDELEKQFAYASVPSLKVYVIVSQEKRELTVFRRSRPGPWAPKVVSDEHPMLKLAEIGVEIPFTRIYERTALARSRTRG